MVYLRARYYAPWQGRFTTQDPFQGIYKQPATLHPYLYAANNPILYTDPSGEFLFLPLLPLAGGIIGGAALGGMAGAAAYIALAARNCEKTDPADLASVIAIGALSGGMIGSGIGLLPLIGGGAGMAGLGYIAANFFTGTKFDRTDFLITSGVGAIASGLTPFWGTSIPGAIALNSAASAAQYGFSEYAHGRDPDLFTLAINGFVGGVFGVFGKHSGSPKNFTNPYVVNPESATRYTFKGIAASQARQYTVEQLPRSGITQIIGTTSLETVKRRLQESFGQMYK